MIEVKMLSRLLPDAPDFARGFIGIVYRANNKSPTPALIVNNMKHGKGCHGAIGIFADIGTEAFISDLEETCTD